MCRKMKDSGIEWIGKIPVDWDVQPLRGSVVDINEKNNPIKFKNVLSLTNTRGVIPYEEKGNQGNISKEDLSQYKIAYKDTVIINSMNLKIGSVGYSDYDGCVSPVYYVLKNKKNSNIKYINYLFKSEFQKYLGKYGKGILEIREKISMYDVMHSYIPVPSIDEQTKIVNYLDDKVSKIDSTIEDNKKSIELLEEYKKNMINKTILEGVRKEKFKFVNTDWFDKIPSSWKISKIKFKANINLSYNLDFEDVDICGYIPMELLYNGYATPNEIEIDKATSGLTKFINNDIIMAKVTPCFENGEIAIVNNLRNGIGLGSSELFVFNCHENKINVEYLFYILQSEQLKEKFKSTMTGTGGLKRVPPNAVKNAYIPIPTEKEQQEIVEYIKKEDNKIQDTIKYRKQIIEKLEEYKKSLIYEAVTGKMEV